MINFINFHKKNMFFALLAFCFQSMLPSSDAQQTPQHAWLTNAAATVGSAFHTLLFAGPNDNNFSSGETALFHHIQHDTLPSPHATTINTCAVQSEPLHTTHQTQNTASLLTHNNFPTNQTQSKPQPQNVHQEPTHHNIASASMSPCAQTVDEFVCIQDREIPSFLIEPSFPTQTATEFQVSALGKSMRETHLKYLLRIIHNGQFLAATQCTNDSFTKNNDPDIGEHTGRALEQSIIDFTQNCTDCSSDEISVLRSQRSHLQKDYENCCVLAQAINLQHNNEPCKKISSTYENLSSKEDVKKSCTVGSKLISANKIDACLILLLDEQKLLDRRAHQIIKEYNDRKQAIHTLRTELHRAHITPEKIRAISPFQPIELVPANHEKDTKTQS